MRSPNVLAATLAVLAMAACAGLTPPSPPSHPPATDLKADSPDDRGSFYMSPGQTLLLETLKNASSRDQAVLALVGRYPNATLFKAGAVGRTTVTAYYDEGSCSGGCNAHAAYMIAVVVVSDLQQGVVVSEQDLSWIVHLRATQPFVVALQNRPGSAPWARLTSDDQKIIVPAGPTTVSTDGIQGRFQAGQPGRSGIEAAGPNCPPGNPCPLGPLADFTVQVFS